MKLSNTFEIFIPLNDSQDFRRLTIAIYLVTAAALLGSGLHWVLALAFCLILVIQLRKALISGKPELDIKSIWIKQNSWILHCTSRELKYEKAESLIDTDWFQLIKLSGEHQKAKVILVFHDQMDAQQIYLLRRSINYGL